MLPSWPIELHRGDIYCLVHVGICPNISEHGNIPSVVIFELLAVTGSGVSFINLCREAATRWNWNRIVLNIAVLNTTDAENEVLKTGKPVIKNTGLF